MKNKDDIYEAFLNAIDEDLRSMCKKNVKAEKPFPYPYCGEKNIERLAKTLVGRAGKALARYSRVGARAVSRRCARGPRAFGRGGARFAVAVFFPAR